MLSNCNLACTIVILNYPTLIRGFDYKSISSFVRLRGIPCHLGDDSFSDLGSALTRTKIRAEDHYLSMETFEYTQGSYQ